MTARIFVMISTVATLALAPCSTALAATFGGTTNGDVMYVGRIDHDGDAIEENWLCVDGVMGDDHWYVLTTAANGTAFDQNVTIQGLGGGDRIVTFTAANTNVSAGESSPCQGTWDPPSLSTYWLDVDGMTGDDEVNGPAGSSASYVYGHEGADYVTLHTSSGVAYGGTGIDVIFGNGGASDRLYGESEADCLDDWSNAWTTYDCGAGTDEWQSGDTGTRTGCEGSGVSCCGLC